MSSSQASPRSRPARVAIVGSGPSGFYTAAALFKQNDLPIEVDFFDRLPTPYGLVRGGVAPDHQNIKGVIRVYEKLARRDELHFFGNVMVGRDLSLEELRRNYDQVVIAAGNESHRRMEIPGEDLDGVHSATAFVGWYNGHPDYHEREFGLAAAGRVAVVGNGNVAMDVTRVLAKRSESMATTDIASYALDALARSAVEEIHVLGRRGPAEAAFTTKEVKEIGSLEDADLVIAPEDAALDAESERWLADKGTPGRGATSSTCSRRAAKRHAASRVVSTSVSWCRPSNSSARTASSPPSDSSATSSTPTRREYRGRAAPASPGSSRSSSRSPRSAIAASRSPDVRSTIAPASFPTGVGE